MSGDYENVVDMPTPEQREARARADEDHRRTLEIFAARADGWRSEVQRYLDNTNPTAPPSTIEHMRAPTNRVYSRYLTPQAKPEIVSTGFADLDALMSFEPGRLVIVGARSSRGKSALSLQFAMNVAMHSGYASLFFAAEMSADEMALRAACMLAGVDSKRVRRGGLGQSEYRALLDAKTTIHKSLSWICDESSLDVLRIRQRSRLDVKRIERECGRSVKLIVVDYLQIVNAGRAAPPGSNREQQVSAVARELKEMARELGVCVVAPAQLNADGDKRGDESRPRASDLRESKGIEAHADVVLLVHNPHHVERSNEPDHDHSQREACELIIDKGRSDGTGAVPVWFTPMFTKFSTMTADEKYARQKRQVPK